MLTPAKLNSVDNLIKTPSSTLSLFPEANGELTVVCYTYSPFAPNSVAALVNAPGHGILYTPGKDRVTISQQSMRLILDYIATLAGGTHYEPKYNLHHDFVVLGPIMATVARLNLERRK